MPPSRSLAALAAGPPTTLGTATDEVVRRRDRFGIATVSIREQINYDQRMKGGEQLRQRECGASPALDGFGEQQAVSVAIAAREQVDECPAAVATGQPNRSRGPGQRLRVVKAADGRVAAM